MPPGLTLRAVSSSSAPAVRRAGTAAPRDNDETVRAAIWRRFEGDDWEAYDALPPVIRQRIQCHAYDAWSVNALMLWRLFRRQTACSQRAQRRLLRILDECEAMEREAFAEAYRRRHGLPLPHVTAGATVMRGGRAAAPPSSDDQAGAKALSCAISPRSMT